MFDCGRAIFEQFRADLKFHCRIILFSVSTFHGEFLLLNGCPLFLQIKDKLIYAKVTELLLFIYGENMFVCN